MERETRQLLLEQIAGCRDAVSDAQAQNAKGEKEHVSAHLRLLDARLKAMRGLLDALDWE